MLHRAQQKFCDEAQDALLLIAGMLNMDKEFKQNKPMSYKGLVETVEKYVLVSAGTELILFSVWCDAMFSL